MSRVSVAEGSKPKPKETFKFLRRDEGRLSYAAGGTADSPSRSNSKINRERRDSKSLREAIAFDMRNAKSHDPLGEVVVAVPRKAPPPNRAASTSLPQSPSHNNSNNSQNTAAGFRGDSSTPAQLQQQQQQRRATASTATKKLPEWVDPEIPSPQRAASAGPASIPTSAAAATAGAAAIPEYELGDVYSRYGGRTPRRAAGVAPPLPRYVDSDYDGVSAVAAATAAPSSVADRNYFRRPPSFQEPPATSSRGREEEDLMLNLELEIRAAQEEREHYAYAKQQLDREKQRFEAYRLNAQQRLDDERLSADGDRVRGQRDTQKDLRSIEERHRNVSALLVTEREANRRLSQENDSLRAQLEDLTCTLREAQRMHKAEVARMVRDIDSLTRRNAALLAMAKEQQLAALEEREGGAGSSSWSSSKNATTASSAAASPALRKAASHNVSAAREHNTVSGPAPSLDVDELSSADDPSSNDNNNNCKAPGVMDFTPRASASEEAARERRNRQMKERIQTERAEMEERRRQREAAMAEKKHAEEESRQKAATAAAAAEEERQKRKEQQEKEKREASAASPAAASSKPVEMRKSPGHPVNTPRLQTAIATVGAAATPKKRLAATAPHPPVPPKSPRISVPTREVLLGDVEPPPTEDFPNDSPVSQTALGDNPNKTETLYRSGKREIHYANGTVKTVLPSGHTVLHFTNGDVKCTFPSGKSTYWYDAAQTMHTQMPDGVQTFEFRTTGQAERHLPDGGKSILYPDGIYKVVHKDGSDETFYPNGEPMEE